MSYRPRTRFSSCILLLACCWAPPVEASPASCSAGFAHLQKGEYKQADASLQECIAALIDAKEPSSKVLWAHFLATVAAYRLSNFGVARDHAKAVESLKTMGNPLSEAQNAFIQHVLSDTMPRYRASVKYTGGIDYGLSLHDGCDRRSREISEPTPEEMDAEELERCQTGYYEKLEQIQQIAPNLYPHKNPCKELLKKYKGCEILYCSNKAYHLEKPFYQTGPPRITCDQDEIAFLRASPEQQKGAVMDAVLGPEGYSMEPEKIRTPPEVTVDPFLSPSSVERGGPER